jgi:putative transposase
MTKTTFQSLVDRQRKSGLSIKDFCLNEAYPVTTFYYWKHKFCISGAAQPSASSGERDHPEEFAPVRFPVPQRDNGSSGNEIMIELPAGIKIHFRGSHVLPQ